MKSFPAWLKWLLPPVLLAALCLYAAWLFLPKGSGAGAVLAALAHPAAADLSLDQRVVLAVRLPRILTALLVGAVLAVSGLLLQTMTRNPLASPSLLSINAGAGLGIIFTGVFLTSAAAGDFSLTVTPAGVNATALVLAAAVFALGLFFAWNSWRAHERSLVALAIAALCTVAALLLDETQASSVMRWLAGSLENITWAQWHQFWPWVLLPILPLLWLLPKLNLLRLSDEAAQSLGLSVRQLRGMVNVIVLAWVGAAVAITGPITFLGLVAPHLARKLVGGRHIYLLPAAMLTGALILQVSDIAVRSIRPPLELPAGIFTALIGAPYFFYLLRRKH